MNIKYTVEGLENETSPIVIFGSGVVGEILLHFCRKKNLEVAAFCDNNNKKAGKTLMGKPIITFPDLQSKYSDAVVLIAVIDIADVVIQLQNSGFSRLYAASEILRDFPVFDVCHDRWGTSSCHDSVPASHGTVSCIGSPRAS